MGDSSLSAFFSPFFFFFCFFFSSRWSFPRQASIWGTMTGIGWFRVEEGRWPFWTSVCVSETICSFSEGAWSFVLVSKDSADSLTSPSLPFGITLSLHPSPLEGDHAMPAWHGGQGRGGIILAPFTPEKMFQNQIGFQGKILRI